ncbi:MAG: homoserine kinase [Bacillota bacterium]
MLKIKVPATSANLGPGYDTFGLALNLFNEYVFKLNNSDQFDLSIKDNSNKDYHIKNEDNLIIKTVNYLDNIYKEKIDLNRLKIDVKLNYPLDRGLGSSANAIIATLSGLNIIYDLNLKKQEILDHALKLEGHPDNITPAFIGGFTVSQNIDEKVVYKKFSISNEFNMLLFIPDIKIKTKMARKVIDNNIPITKVSKNIANASILTAGIVKNDIKLIKKGSNDHIHQYKRLSLNKDLKLLFKNIIKKTDLPIFLSGSGPTIILISNKNITNIKEIVKKEAKKIGIVNYLIETKPNNKGIIIENGDNNVERFN